MRVCLRRFPLSRLFAVLAALLAIFPIASGAQTRPATDDAGRTVSVPANINRVMAAGPPASILLYTLAPELMAGWIIEPTAEQKTYLAAPYRDMPAHGRLIHPPHWPRSALAPALVAGMPEGAPSAAAIVAAQARISGQSRKSP